MKNLLSVAVILGLATFARAASPVGLVDPFDGGQTATPGQQQPLRIQVVVPNQAEMVYDVSIPSTAGTAVEVTGNIGPRPGVVGNVTGIAILNWSTGQDIYCCDNDSACSVSAGTHHGWPILRQPSGGNYNWQYFSVPEWGQLWCIATGSSVTATIRRFH